MHLETTQIDHGWTRGLETAEIVSPIQKRIGIHAFGWSKGTDGEVSGQVLALDIQKPSDFDALQREAKGRDRHDAPTGGHVEARSQSGERLRRGDPAVAA